MQLQWLYWRGDAMKYQPYLYLTIGFLIGLAMIYSLLQAAPFKGAGIGLMFSSLPLF